MWNLRSFGCAVLLMMLAMFAMPRSAQAAPPPRMVLVEDFEGDPPNRLGGYHEKYQAGDSVAVFSRSATVARGQGRSLCIQGDRRTTGYCGVWMHFFNFKVPQKQYFDARPFSYLSFWVRGQRGGERFTIKLADRTWIEKEDSVAVGEISTYLPKGVTTTWQEVLIPLSSARNLDLQTLGGLTIDFSAPGQHTIYLDDVCFKAAVSIITPQSTVAVDNTPVLHAPRALWLWETTAILHDAETRQQLFGVCKAHGIDQLWMQIVYKVEKDESREVPVRPIGLKSTTQSTVRVSCSLNDPVALRRFLAEAHEAGVQVHALDGYPEFALKSQHAVPLAVVDAVIEFNRGSDPNQRFDGIHFDNEPYLILAWHDRLRREQILREFLELNVECQRRVREQPGLKFGIDIPFWWQEVDPKTGRPAGEVTFAGKKKPASHHCIDLLDQVGIMNYRDAADGADGMIAHGKDLMAYADQVGGARIHMGVETFLAPPTDVWFVVGVPRKRFETAVRGPARELSSLSRLDRFRIRSFDDGQNIHVGLELPQEPSEDDLKQAQRHLLTLAEHFGASAVTTGSPKSPTTAARDLAESTLRRDPEWRGFRNRDIVTPKGSELPGFVATSIMLPKITFGDNSQEEFAAELKAAETSFRRSPKFFGMAIHSYESFLKLPETRRISARR